MDEGALTSRERQIELASCFEHSNIVGGEPHSLT
jgi:hypothetical protein